jgi:FkbM family methyltransferase
MNQSMKRFLGSMKMMFLRLFFHRKKVTLFDVFFSYRLILGRLPDAQGWNHYRTFLRESSLTPDSFAESFLRSPEFLQKQKSSLNRGKAADYDSLPMEEDTVSLPNFKILIDRHDHFIGRGIKSDGVYEPHVAQALERILHPGGTFVDVGANIGYFSLLASTLVGPGGKVLAFEPMEENIVLFRKSVRLNQFHNIHIFQKAVLNKNGMVHMILWDRRNSGSFHILNNPYWEETIYEVEAVKLDDFLSGERVDVIKVDVEGSEGLVFQGMIETIRRYHPILILEFTPLGLKDISSISGEEFLKAFENLDYSFQDIHSFNGVFSGKSIGDLNALMKKRKTSYLDLLLFPNSGTADPRDVIL